MSRTRRSCLTATRLSRNQINRYHTAKLGCLIPLTRSESRAGRGAHCSEPHLTLSDSLGMPPQEQFGTHDTTAIQHVRRLLLRLARPCPRRCQAEPRGRRVLHDIPSAAFSSSSRFATDSTRGVVFWAMSGQCSLTSFFSFEILEVALPMNFTIRVGGRPSWLDVSSSSWGSMCLLRSSSIYLCTIALSAG